MALCAIAYASEAIPGLAPEKVEDLSRAAARFNLEAGVTGVLLFDGSRFLQYVEGPEDAIGVVYGRILASRSHDHVVELGRGRVIGRFFPYWSMRTIPAQPDDLRDVVRGDWIAFNRGGAVSRLARVVSPYIAA